MIEPVVEAVGGRVWLSLVVSGWVSQVAESSECSGGWSESKLWRWGVWGVGNSTFIVIPFLYVRRLISLP